MGDQDTVKICGVPMCLNTSINAPNKFFINVPKNIRMRHFWMKAARVQTSWKRAATVYFCEDHFELQEDLDQEVKQKFTSGHLVLKRGVVPRYFYCQNRLSRQKCGRKKSYIQENGEGSSDRTEDFEFVTVDDESEENDMELSGNNSYPMEEQQAPPADTAQVPVQYESCNQEEPQLWMYDMLPGDGSQTFSSNICIVNGPASATVSAQDNGEVTEGLMLAYVTEAPVQQPHQEQVQQHDHQQEQQHQHHHTNQQQYDRHQEQEQQHQHHHTNQQQYNQEQEQQQQHHQHHHTNQQQYDQHQEQQHQSQTEKRPLRPNLQQVPPSTDNATKSLKEVLKEVVATNREVAAAIKELATSTYLLATAKKRTAKAEVVMAKIALEKAKKEGVM